MKQGTGSSTSHGKDPGKASGISPGYVSQLGAKESYLRNAKPPTMKQGSGRGSSSPSYKVNSHCCGSQGKY